MTKIFAHLSPELLRVAQKMASFGAEGRLNGDILELPIVYAGQLYLVTCSRNGQETPPNQITFASLHGNERMTLSLKNGAACLLWFVTPERNAPYVSPAGFYRPIRDMIAGFVQEGHRGQLIRLVGEVFAANIDADNIATPEMN